MDKGLLKEKEGEHFDRKRSFEDYDSIGETIAAFASSYGGYLLVGQANDLSIVGVKDDPETISRLGQIIRNCEPIPSTEGPFFMDVDGKKVAVLRVISLGKAWPCFYKCVPYLRVVDSNNKIAGRDLYRLWTHSGRISFEERESSATKGEIDSDVLDYYKEKISVRGEFNVDAWMKNRKLTVNGSLSNIGVLVLAKNPTNHLSRPQITMIRYKGTDPANRVAAITLSQPLHKLFASCENFLRINLLVSEKMEEMRRLEDTIIPWAAVREALVNAIAHRDYESASETMVRIFDDRIEFINPGAPDPENWKKILQNQWPIHRNPILYDFVRMEGVGEGAGQGLVIMRNAMLAAGLESPEYHVAQDSFMVVLRAKQEEKKTEATNELLEFLKKKKEVTTTEIMAALKVSRPTAIGMMELVVRSGVWKKIGVRKGRKYIR
ncbi:Uncharacterised protein [uncultured archaeon]|nr:Uncharacterised protein [uncultured archaeon]